MTYEMSNISACIDTNYLIYLFSDSKEQEVSRYSGLIISRITYIEFLSFDQLTSEEVSQIEEQLEENFQIVELTEEISKLSAELSRAVKAFRLADAVILATSLVNNSELLTFDEKLKRYFDIFKQAK